MAALLALAGASVVVGLPGLAALCAVRPRHLPPAERLSCTVALLFSGIGISAISLWLAALVFGMSPWTAAGAPAVVAACIQAAGRITSRAARPSDERTMPSPGAHAALRWLPACSIASIVLVAIPFAPYGWERADGIHRMAMTDWEKHLVMATGIAGSSEFPPPHPYIVADPEPSYYFGFHIVGAAIALVSHPDADVFPALWLLTLITAGATPFVVYLLARSLCDERPALAAACASTLLVGFDAVVLVVDTARAAATAWPLPGGFAGLRALVPSTHIDYWIHNLDRSFSAPLVTTMWAPHQTAATLVALVVLYLLGPGQPRRQARTLALCGLLIASLAALSTYIALALGAGVAAAVAVECWRARTAPWRTDVVRRWGPAGALGVLVALPVLPTVAHGASSGLIVRLSAAGSWSNGAIFSWLFGPSQWTLLLDTPAVYFFELGAIGLFAALLFRRRPALTPAQREAAIVAAAVLVLVIFVRPPIGVGNNLYARALLLPWFLLAPFAAIAALERRSRMMVVAVAICAAGTAYVQVGYLLEGGLFWATPKPAVDALRWVNTHTPRSARVAIRPTEYENLYGYWLRRPLVIGGRRLALLFGAQADLYDRTAASLEDAFGQPDADAAHAAFDRLHADVIVARAAEAPFAWADGPCFSVAYENTEWIVILRQASPCRGRTDAAQGGPKPAA